ncbi:MAG: hypothetical protein NVSMB56_11130 [Pyrinomonadaceae bacterium]
MNKNRWRIAYYNLICLMIFANINCASNRVAQTLRANEIINTVAKEKNVGSIKQPPDAPQPNPKLSPEDVVKLQLEALQHNDTPSKDTGIAVAFRFASPANQVATGPLENFVLLVKNPMYRSLLNHKKVERDKIEVDGDEARQRVTITAAGGERIKYLFTLSKQKDGQFKDCWMTDGVERVTGIEQDPNVKIAQTNGHLPPRII